MEANELRVYAVAQLRLGTQFYLMADELVFADATMVAPTEEEIRRTLVLLTEQVQQAQAMREQIYSGLTAVLVGLIGQAATTWTAAQLKALWILERYTERRVTLDAKGQLASLPAVETAPIVYPVQLQPVGMWLMGIDNQAAWADFVSGNK